MVQKTVVHMAPVIALSSKRACMCIVSPVLFLSLIGCINGMVLLLLQLLVGPAAYRLMSSCCLSIVTCRSGLEAMECTTAVFGVVVSSFTMTHSHFPHQEL